MTVMQSLITRNRTNPQSYISGLKCLSKDSRVSMLATLVNANFCSSGKCLNTAFYMQTSHHILHVQNVLPLLAVAFIIFYAVLSKVDDFVTF